MVKKGLLIILSGPSGVGKGTVRRELFKEKDLNLAYSISMTTRPPRSEEVEGVDYFFVNDATFYQALEENKLLESAEFVNHCYGTPTAYVDKLLEEGKNVVLEIEVEGAKQVMEKCPEALSIFLVPPSMEILEQRIRNRRSEPKEIVNLRLQKANHEMGLKDKYQHVVVNDDVSKAKDEIAMVIRKHLK